MEAGNFQIQRIVPAWSQFQKMPGINGKTSMASKQLSVVDFFQKIIEVVVAMIGLFIGDDCYSTLGFLHKTAGNITDFYQYQMIVLP